MTTIDNIMALAQSMAVASIGKPDAVALIEARAALLTTLQKMLEPKGEQEPINPGTVVELAKAHGSRYVNRHYLEKPSYGFTSEGLIAFAKAIAAPRVAPVVKDSLTTDAIDTSQERVEKEREIKRIGCVQHDCAECKAQETQLVPEPLTIAKLVDIALTASSRGLVSGTSNWAAFVLQGIADRQAQPAREPLTVQECSVLMLSVLNGEYMGAGQYAFIRAIEKAHGIGDKNG